MSHISNFEIKVIGLFHVFACIDVSLQVHVYTVSTGALIRPSMNTYPIIHIIIVKESDTRIV